MSRVLGVLGGDDLSDSLLKRWARSATALYAADAAADRLVWMDFKPVLVGDLDSFRSTSEMHRLRVVHIPDQDSTDCDKLLRTIEEDGHREVTLIGMEGDLPDHMLATYSSAVRSGLGLRFAFRRGVGWLLRSRSSVAVRTKRGCRVSLMPLTPCTGVCLRGVHWPVENASMEVGGLNSCSNAAEWDRVEAEVRCGAALLFVQYPEAEMPFWST